jgi:hypothetical protein
MDNPGSPSTVPEFSGWLQIGKRHQLPGTFARQWLAEGDGETDLMLGLAVCGVGRGSSPA